MNTNDKLKAPLQAEHSRKGDWSLLRSPNLLAQRPAIGLILFIFGSLVFGLLAFNLYSQGPLLAWDKTIANTLPAIGLKSPPIVKDLMMAGFYAGKQVVMYLSILLAIYFLFKKFWQEFAMVVIGWSGSALIFYTLSMLIGRVRPSTQIWVVVNIPGFPSGHAVAVVTFYGLMAYLLIPKMPSMFWKVFVGLIALLIIGFVGFSRIFTGGHYFTDIMAGYAVGLAWSGAAYTLIEIYFQKRRRKHVKEG